MNTRIDILEFDITKLYVDAIVNAANRTLLGGGGVDGAIHRAAGPKLLEECCTLKGCDTGEAKITKGYNLFAKYVIHTVGPVWQGGNSNEDNLLSNCYKNCFRIAEAYEVRSIAFPAISTGAYSFPFERASKIVCDITKDVLKNESILEKIIFVFFSSKEYLSFKKIAEDNNLYPVFSLNH
jgi:O-acetyl-ADP-ribose deacetylase (regulator of RNase III)